jgi:hypothetical protein
MKNVTPNFKTMRQLLLNIFLFLASITLFCFAAPQIPATDEHHSTVPVNKAPKDSTSVLWGKDSNLQARTALSLKKRAD